MAVVIGYLGKHLSFFCMKINHIIILFRCQTYEGGFGATPENEVINLIKTYLFYIFKNLLLYNKAHGGYSFCGLAALKLLGKEKLCDIDLLTVNLI
jgi:prenyltransferase beta subunit